MRVEADFDGPTFDYKAKNGKVTFVLVGDTVTIEAAGGSEKKD